jgi:hypothetical protein
VTAVITSNPICCVLTERKTGGLCPVTPLFRQDSTLLLCCVNEYTAETVPVTKPTDFRANSEFQFNLHETSEHPSHPQYCKIWGFHSSDYEEWCLLGYKNPVCTSQETQYVSVTESSQLMLCKIWGFHGSDYEEWHLLGYKNPVCTSQETHYVSATESSQLMICKTLCFHDSD